MGGWRDCHCRRGVRLTNWSEPLDSLINPSYLPDMKQTKFDQNGIFASTPELTAIALQVMEQEKRERELRREWFSKWNDSRPDDGGQWGIWNISDRD